MVHPKIPGIRVRADENEPKLPGPARVERQEFQYFVLSLQQFGLLKEVSPDKVLDDALLNC